MKEELKKINERIKKADKRLAKEWVDGYETRGAMIQKGKALATLRKFCDANNIQFYAALFGEIKLNTNEEKN